MKKKLFTVVITALVVLCFSCEKDDVFEDGNTSTIIGYDTINFKLIEYNGHQFVDLGLPSGTLWATCNIGATKPMDSGDYFAWGEITTKNYYNYRTYFDSLCNKYNIDGGKLELDDEDDVAVQLWGNGCKMPTFEQQTELMDECYWIWTDSYNGSGVNGYIVYKTNESKHKGEIIKTGDKIISNYNIVDSVHIFLPAVGYRWNKNESGPLDGVGPAGYAGHYWSRSLDVDNPYDAYRLRFYSDYVVEYGGARENGFSVRAVLIDYN